MVIMESFFKIHYLFIFRERGREGGDNQCMIASPTPLPSGTWPETQACALDWEWNQ